MTIHDRNLLPLLHDLAVGRPAGEMAAAAVGHSEEAILAVLALMSWCGLLDSADTKGGPATTCSFTRAPAADTARVPLGKTNPGGDAVAQPAPMATVNGMRRLVLEAPDLRRLLAEDPPYALVSERRQSVRRQGSARSRRVSSRSSCFARFTRAGGGVPTRAGAPAIR